MDEASATGGRVSKKTPEGYVKAAVIEYLQRQGFELGTNLFRMNSGSMLVESKGKTRRIAMGEKGTADLLALPLLLPAIWPNLSAPLMHPMVVWLECKAEGGKQTAVQKDFEARVTAEGHRYAVVRSIEDVKALGL